MVGADPGVRVPGLKAYKSPELRTEKFLISGKKKSCRVCSTPTEKLIV